MRTGIHTFRHTSATSSLLTFFTFAFVHYCLIKRYRTIEKERQCPPLKIWLELAKSPQPGQGGISGNHLPKVWRRS